MATIRQFEDLQCWQLARAVAQEVYRLTRGGAMASDRGLVDQIRRAAGSVMDNIAEGFDRGSRGEFVQFLGYAKGSAGEVKSQLYRSLDQGYVSPAEFATLADQLDHLRSGIKRLLWHLHSTSIKGERFHQAQEPLPPYSTPSNDFPDLSTFQ